jgi:anti-sigma-K factor RskA
LDLEDYIESGIIESYLLGLATREEVMMFERMRNIYPQLNGEIATMEYKLQRLGEEGGIAPPAQVWNRIAERIQWEEAATETGTKQKQNQVHTYIIQAQNRTMTISIWWRCAFIALCVIVMALMASTFYFYRKYSQLEQHLLQIYPTSQPISQPVVK